MKNNQRNKLILEIIRDFLIIIKLLVEYIEKREQQKSCDRKKWDKDKHPKDKKGRFTKKGSSETSSKEEKKEEKQEEHKEENNSGENQNVNIIEDSDNIEKKIANLKNIDWSRNNILPSFPKEILEKYGLENKPIYLKQEIINRNNKEHSDAQKDAVRILGNALYKTEVILKGKPNRPNYFNFITRIDDDYSDLVLLEIVNTKKSYEIVHFFKIRNKSRRALERDDKRQS